MSDRSGSRSQRINWATNALAAFVQNVSVDHRGGHVRVAEEFLHGSNVITRFEEMCRKRMVVLERGDKETEGR